MTAQQTAAKEPDYERGYRHGEIVAADAERRRIRRALLALYVDARSVWLYRESVIAAIKKATRAPGRERC